MDEQAERLVRVETKLDALITLNDTRITANERRIDEVRQEAADRTRHEKANYDQKLIAIGMTAETRSTGIEKRVDKIDGHITKLVWMVVGSVLLAVIAMVVIKPDRPATPQAQLTVPAIVQQAFPHPAQPPAASK